MEMLGVMEDSLRNNPDISFWKNKKVLVTGHTGFKGSWLTLWLLKMGVKVCGISLEPESEKNLFDLLNLKKDIEHNICDIRSKDKIKNIINDFKPEIVFHLAAQPLVLTSYAKPFETWEINVIGTINILESIISNNQKCSSVFITTDKVYQNNEWVYGYREIDKLGGNDPYSSSKAAAEIAIHSWRESFCGPSKNQKDHIFIASARAGNVIGGGDWSANRIVPDISRALVRNNKIEIRNPLSTRPWQHVIEPLAGYIILAEKLHKTEDRNIASSFNFGPDMHSNQTVRELVKECLKHWDGKFVINKKENMPHEAGKLNLVIDKANNMLLWRPKLNFKQTVELTINWYKNFELNSKTAFECCEYDLLLYLDS